MPDLSAVASNIGRTLVRPLPRLIPLLSPRAH